MAAPDIIPHFSETLAAIQGIEDEIKDMVHKVLKDISASSSEILPEFLGAVREGLFPVFAEALLITGMLQDTTSFPGNQD